MAGLGLALLVVASCGAQAQSSRERLLGTLTTREARPDEAGAVAARMLADALTALEQGDIMLGRRRLEVLVERFPDSLAASSARHELGRLYRDQTLTGRTQEESARPRWLSPAPPPTPTARETATRPGSTEAPPVEVRSAADDRRLQALARDFQIAAGDRVFFAEASADLGAKPRAVLAAQARWLLRHSDIAIVIEAHADDHGSREQNIELSERRGLAVRDRLIEEGVEAGRIKVRALGRDMPVATCPAAECAAQNRRVITSIGSGSAAASERPRAVSPDLATGLGQVDRIDVRR
jgi:peptidoglycan-associated lipoprotein